MNKLKILLIGIVFLLLTSCSEKAQVVEVQRLIVDTMYIYKVKRLYTIQNEYIYDIETSRQRFDIGDEIIIRR